MKNFAFLAKIVSICFAFSSEISQASQVIYDYPVQVESLTVEPTEPSYEVKLPEGALPVQLRVTGSLPTKGNSSIQTQIEGVSLPLGIDSAAFTYKSILLLDGFLYAVNSYIIKSDKDLAKATVIAELDSRGQVRFLQEWQPDIVYREYRYTLQDKVSALLFGIKTQNQEFTSLTLRRSN